LTIDGLVDKILAGSPWAIVIILGWVVYRLYRAGKAQDVELKNVLLESSAKEQALHVAYNQKLMELVELRYQDLGASNEKLHKSVDELSHVADVLMRNNGGTDAT